jgi:hypothetical protein
MKNLLPSLRGRIKVRGNTFYSPPPAPPLSELEALPSRRPSRGREMVITFMVYN